MIISLIEVSILIGFAFSNITLGVVTFTALFSVFVFINNLLNSQPVLNIELYPPISEASNWQLRATNIGSVPIPLDRAEIGIKNDNQKWHMRLDPVYVEGGYPIHSYPVHQKANIILQSGERIEPIMFNNPNLIDFFLQKGYHGDIFVYAFIYDRIGREYQSKESYKLVIP
jgi:hypothetical protein